MNDFMRLFSTQSEVQRTMIQTVERLDLPSSTYGALEQIARLQGVTPLQVIEHWVQQYQQSARLHTLRQEYQELIDIELQRALTDEDAQRLDCVCAEINQIEMASEANRTWQQRAAAIDARLDETDARIR